MRLDHLLSREKARREIGSLHLSRYTERCKREKSPDEESGVDWKVLLEDVSFSGIERFLNVP